MTKRTTRRIFVGGTLAGTGGLVVGCGEDAPVPSETAASGNGGVGGVGGGDGGSSGGDPGQPVHPPEEWPEGRSYPFGVSSGDARTTAAVLWTQYTGSRPLEAAVWHMDGEAYVAELGPFAASPAEGGFVHTEAIGLTAGERYRFVFFELERGERMARSPIGRFRAAIADDATEPLVFGAIACTDRSRPYDTLARAALRNDLDLFMFLGDNSYCDGASTLAEYRGLYIEHLGKPEHAALRASTSMLITWDDHEVTNDYNPELIDAEQMAAATQAFFEHAAIRRLPEATD